jgi:hypothetical protein
MEKEVDTTAYIPGITFKLPLYKIKNFVKIFLMFIPWENSSHRETIISHILSAMNSSRGQLCDSFWLHMASPDMWSLVIFSLKVS